MSLQANLSLARLRSAPCLVHLGVSSAHGLHGREQASALGVSSVLARILDCASFPHLAITLTREVAAGHPVATCGAGD